MTKKCVLYLRYSSASQTEQSIEGQDQVCRAYAKQHDLLVVGSYIDRARSASHDIARRTEFQRMLRDAKNGGFDFVLVYKLDRFARDRYDSATSKAALKKCGVSVISATESLSEGPEGIIVESLLEGMAEYYSAELSQKIRRGISVSKEKQKHLGGPTPFGLMVKDGKLAPDPVNAPAVRMIFEMADQGFSFVEIVAALNQAGFRTLRGRLFTASSIRRLIHSKKYIGYYVYDDVEIPGAFEPVVDEALFYRVQERIMKEYKKKKCKHNADGYLLTGRLFCGSCGMPMHGESGKGRHGDVYRYYKCSGRKQGSGCTMKSVRKEDIEGLVLAKARAQLTPERIEWLADEMMAALEAQRASSDVVPALKEQLREIDRKLNTAIDAVLGGLSSATLASRISDLEEQKSALEQRIDLEAAARPSYSREMAVYFLSQLAEKADCVSGGNRLLIDTFIEKVTVFEEKDPGNSQKSSKIEIFFKLSPDSSISETARNAPPLCADSNIFVCETGVFFILITDLWS